MKPGPPEEHPQAQRELFLQRPSDRTVSLENNTEARMAGAGSLVMGAELKGSVNYCKDFGFTWSATSE